MACSVQPFERRLTNGSGHGTIQLTYDLSRECVQVSAKTIFVEEHPSEEDYSPTNVPGDAPNILPEEWESRHDELQCLSTAFNFLLPMPILSSPQCWLLDLDENALMSPADIIKTLDIDIDLSDTIQDIFTRFFSSSSPEIPGLLKQCPAEFILKLFKNQKLHADGNIYATGSRSEGLSFPTHIGIDNYAGVTSFDQSDLDFLFVLSVQIPPAISPLLHTLLQSYTKIADASYWDVVDAKPGYIRHGPALWLVSNVTKLISKTLQKFGNINGPAVDPHVPLRPTDIVMAFEHLKWPSQAAEWSTRHRSSGWPNSKLVHDIMQAGIHIIQKSHPHTDATVENEWRLSFSIAEKMLASSMSKVQKQSYLLIKTLYLQKLKSSGTGGLSSYHLKTLFLWRAELFSASDWQSSQLGQHVIGMLLQLQQYLQEGFMPNYFIPSCNLFDHIENEEIAHLLVIIPVILADPMKYILGFLENNRFFAGPFTTSWEEAKTLFEAVAIEKRRNELIDKAIQLSSWYIQDYPIAEKLAHDILQFHINFTDFEQNRELFRCFFKQQMIPLRAALFTLQEAIGTSTQTHLNAGLPREIMKLLTEIRDDDVVRNRWMPAVQEYEPIEQFFKQRMHVGLQEAAKNLHALLVQTENQHLELYDQLASPSQKGKATWSVLTRLIAHIFIIENSGDKAIKHSQMECLCHLVEGLADMKYPECIYQCGKQLEVHALLKLKDIERADEILEESTGIGSKARMYMLKLKDQAVQETNLDDAAVLKLRVGDVELLPVYRSRFVKFKSRPQRELTYSDILAEWLNMIDALDLSKNLRKSHPVGKMNMDRNSSKKAEFCAIFNFDRELSRCFFLPERNMLRNTMHKMIESGAELDEVGSSQWHVAWRVAAAKYLIVVGKHTKACEVLMNITNKDDFCLEMYPLCPRLSETLLDVTIFSSQEGKHFHLNAVCFVHVIMYAHYLLVIAFTRMNKKHLARASLGGMMAMGLKLQQEKSDQTWEVFANDLVLLSHAHHMCDSKQQALAALGQVALLETTNGKKGLGMEAAWGDFCVAGKSLLDIFAESLKALREVNCYQEQYSSLDALMRVYYPDQPLYDALTNLLHYTNEGCDGHIEKITFAIDC